MKLPRLAVLAIFFFGIILGTILVAIGGFAFNDVMLGIGIAILFISAVFHMIFYRCPHCKRYLNRSYGQYCPRCGKFID